MTEQTDPFPNEPLIERNSASDGIDRRGFLKCMAWAGTGVLCVLNGGILKSYALGAPNNQSEGRFAHLAAEVKGADFSFVQISDSHIGFSKAANPDVTATFQEAVTRINSLPRQPDFILHTGDLSQLSKADQFDTVEQVLKSAKTKTGSVFYVPGEHDVLNDNGLQYRQRFGKGTLGDGWYSFDHLGVHLIGLVNVLDLKPGGLGSLGQAQIDWLKNDVAGLSSETPIVVFAHVPLWTVYPQWGWGTDDSAQALSFLKRFGSVTVLNGHIHQTLQKVEGNVTFHTAMSTAFPQPAPGTAPSPGPMTVPAGQLRSVLGIRTVSYVEGARSLAVVDTPLAANGASDSQTTADRTGQVVIENFHFRPATLTIRAGTSVTWINRDDEPHTVVSDRNAFKSDALDTDGKFSHVFDKPGEYGYFCSVHPMMTAKIIVQ